MSEFVYFIQGEDGGPIKIGKAVSPERRLSLLQTGSPVKLVLRFTIRTNEAYETEAQLHRLFGCFRLHGEWFKPHPILAGMCAGVADESLVNEPLVYPDGFRPSRLLLKLLNPEDFAAHEAEVLAQRAERWRQWELRKEAEGDLMASDFPITSRPDDFEGDHHNMSKFWRAA